MELYPLKKKTEESGGLELCFTRRGRAWGQPRSPGATVWDSLVPSVHIYEHMSSPCPSVLLHSAVELKEGGSTAGIDLFS